MAAEWGIRVIPCYINFADESLLDQVQLSRDEFYQRLIAAPVPPTTAAPPPGLFAEAYRELLDRASAIVSIHPSDHLSGLRQSAINGWDWSRPRSPTGRGRRSAQHGVGMDRPSGGAGGRCWRLLVGPRRADRRSPRRVHLYAALDTVEYLQRSGRVGWAQGTIGRLCGSAPSSSSTRAR